MLVFLLGNPGPEYATTRHNAAWLLTDDAFPELEWELDSYHKSYVAQTEIAGQHVVFAKPTTFMNLAGDALRLLIKKYNLKNSEIIVAGDDVDIPLGKLQITQTRGAANHNGVLSVMHTAGPDVIRIRVGIQSDRKNPLRDFVLQKFSAEQLMTLRGSAANFAAAIRDIVEFGPTKAMNTWNKK